MLYNALYFRSAAHFGYDAWPKKSHSRFRHRFGTATWISVQCWASCSQGTAHPVHQWMKIRPWRKENRARYATFMGPDNANLLAAQTNSGMVRQLIGQEETISRQWTGKQCDRHDCRLHGKIFNLVKTCPAAQPWMANKTPCSCHEFPASRLLLGVGYITIPRATAHARASSTNSELEVSCLTWSCQCHFGTPL